MRVLVIGGTGLISAGIVKHLLARGAEVTVLNRGQRADGLPAQVRRLRGERDDPATLPNAAAMGFDAVIDMICFNAAQAELAIRAFGGRCRQFIFCSTVCAYGFEMPPGVLIDETYVARPSFGYGRGKLEAEQAFLRADREGAFAATIIRPSHTYGPGSSLIDQLEFDPPAWDRIERGLPVLCAGDGLGLWQSTHRDDCGKLFAYAALNPRTFGQSYNATQDEIRTWRDYYRTVATVLGRPARLVFLPVDRIVAEDRPRFGLLADITRYHGAYSSAKAARDVPEFRCSIGLADGAREVFADSKRRGAWRRSADDAVYERLLGRAAAAGIAPVDA
jgi:nucleoside-diphosphate-sugar epimerase